MRQFVCGTVTVWGVLLEAHLVVPDMKFLAVTKLAIASAHSLAHIGAMMGVVHYWTFPIPFTFAVGGIPFAVFLSLLVAAALGCQDRKVFKGFSTFPTLSASRR